MEDKNISIEKCPKKLYHIVPISIFKKYTNRKGEYDPRNKIDTGKNSPYVHTTPSIDQMNKHLIYLRELPDKHFYLLEIDIAKLNPDKVTYTKFEDRIYHHLWCPLNRSSYTMKIVEKDSQGQIILS